MTKARQIQHNQTNDKWQKLWKAETRLFSFAIVQADAWVLLTLSQLEKHSKTLPTFDLKVEGLANPPLSTVENTFLIGLCNIGMNKRKTVGHVQTLGQIKIITSMTLPLIQKLRKLHWSKGEILDIFDGVAILSPYWRMWIYAWKHDRFWGKSRSFGYQIICV